MTASPLVGSYAPQHRQAPAPQPELPTTTLYFLEPVRRLAARHDLPTPERLSRHVWACGDVGVVSRYLRPVELNRIRERRFSRLVYLIDDNIIAGAYDPALPLEYRRRLKDFHETGHALVLREATDVVVPNRLLADLYRALAPNAEVHLTHPLWPERKGPPRLQLDDGRLRIAYLGSRSHMRDIRVVAKRLARFLRGREDVELYTTLDPGNVFSREGVRCFRLPVMPWRDHMGFVRDFAADIGLNPLIDTPFNRCRSINKFVEYGSLGAVCLYSRAVIQSDDALAMPDRFALSNRPAEWIQRIRAYCEDRSLLAADRQRYLSAIRDWSLEERTLGLWERLLGFASTRHEPDGRTLAHPAIRQG